MQIMISASCKCLLLLIALVIEVFLMTHFIISLVITYRYKLFIANKYIFMKNFLSCAIKKLILYRKMLFLVAFKQPYLFEEAGHRHCLYFFGFFFFTEMLCHMFSDFLQNAVRSSILKQKSLGTF